MAQKRHKPDKIVTKLRQVEMLRGQGVAMAHAVRQIGILELIRLSRKFNSADVINVLSDLFRQAAFAGGIRTSVQVT